MQKMILTQRNTTSELGINNTKFNFPLDKPMLCPHCSAYQNGSRISSSSCYSYNDSNIFLNTTSYKCSACNKSYLVLYLIDCIKQKSTFEAIYPSVKLEYFNDRIKEISPRFIDMYNQALASESLGNTDLAAIGYRTSLEILLKDFAIVELKKDKNEIAKKDLFNIIDLCLDKSVFKGVDVVRILGNDFTHYERKYPELDFEVLKQYMEISIRLIDTQLMINHPPVERS